MINLEAIINRVEDLPPLPNIVVKLLHASRDPSVSTREMVELIKHDPALTIKVLRLCNSSYYGLPRKINSIQEALVYIGTDTLVNFVLAGCLSTFYQQAQDGYGLEKGELWRHSVGCAIACQLISESSEGGMTGLAFTAGLIHDIGKVILNDEVGNELTAIMEVVENEQISFNEAEEKVLGFSQTKAGSMLARHWNLPDALIEAIEFHQNPTRSKTTPKLVAQVHLANILCLSFGIGVGNDGLAYAFEPQTLEAVNLDVADLFRLSIDIHNGYKKAEDLIGLAI